MFLTCISLALQVKNVSIGNSLIEEAVLVNQTLGHHVEVSATSIVSVKARSDEGTLTTPRKTRKGSMKTLQVGGLKSFKLSLGVRKKKKQKKGRSSSLAVKAISEKLPPKKRATDKERKTSQISTSASGSACLNGKDNRVIVKERSNQNSAVLTSDQQQTLKSSDMSEASQNAKRKRELSKKQDEEEATVLTRGLPETFGKFSVFSTYNCYNELYSPTLIL